MIIIQKIQHCANCGADEAYNFLGSDRASVLAMIFPLPPFQTNCAGLEPALLKEARIARRSEDRQGQNPLPTQAAPVYDLFFAL